MKIIEVGEGYRLRQLARFATGKVLDLGCSQQPNPYIKDAYGLDILPTFKGKKADNYKELVLLKDGHNPYPYPFEDNFFDCVIAGEFIEHIADTDTWLKEIYRIMKPGGVLSISTPNPESPIEVAVHAGHWIKGYNFDHMKEFDHVNEFPVTNMINLLNLNGLKPFKIEGTYIHIPWSNIYINMNCVPLTYCTIFHARKVIK